MSDDTQSPDGFRVVSTAAELAQAVEDSAERIEVSGTISGGPSVTLPPGTHLRGGELRFSAKGVRLTRDNTLEDVTVVTRDTEVAILNDTRVSDLGTLTLRSVRATGQVYLRAEDAVRAGRVVVDGLHVMQADVRGRFDRPHGFGVDTLQGAFTLWNRQADAGVVISAELKGLSAGSESSPVRGSGIFVAGHGDEDGIGDGGRVEVSVLETGDVFADGGIADGAADLISGGVFVVSGATVTEVVNTGTTTTYGPNDMVLDNWGDVARWTTHATVTSRGPSGIGFVNFGDLGTLDVRAPVQTFGIGARGFNVYDGTLQSASFTTIATHGDGSIGIQVSRELPRLVVGGDVSTRGGTGQSLVRGVQMTLAAEAISIQPTGKVGSLEVGGSIVSVGADITTLDVEGDPPSLSVAGDVRAEGERSDAIRVTRDDLDLGAVKVVSHHGREVVRASADEQ